MIFAIDLDNTLFYNDIVKNVCSKNNILHDNSHFDLSDLPPKVQKECFKSFNDPKLMCDLKPIPNVSTVLWYWNLNFYNMNYYCVSARSHHLYESTKEMVKTHYPMIKDLILVESFDKTAVYKQLNPNVVIDDNPEHIKQALNIGIKHNYLISNSDTPYNFKDVERLKSRNVKVVSSINKIDSSNFF